MTYNVFSGTLNPTQSIPDSLVGWGRGTPSPHPPQHFDAPARYSGAFGALILMPVVSVSSECLCWES